MKMEIDGGAPAASGNDFDELYNQSKLSMPIKKVEVIISQISLIEL
jgi:hypothetical protein